MRKFLLLTSGALLFLMSVAHASEQDAICGDWYTQQSKAIVEIYPCSDRYCGKIVWLKEPLNADGSIKRDIHNPDEAQRQKPIIGLNLVSDFEFKGDGRWDNGRIYDPENGKTYACKLRLEQDLLKVRGYVGVSLFGRTEVWQRKN